MIRGKHFVRKDRTNLSFVSDFEKPHHGMKRVFNKINKKKKYGNKVWGGLSKEQSRKRKAFTFFNAKWC